MRVLSDAHQRRRAPLHDAPWPRALRRANNFYASGLIAAGCDVVTVQRALGHASATTLHTYRHLWPTAEDRSRKELRAGVSA
jgi:site-specific recombinase XerD